MSLLSIMRDTGVLKIHESIKVWEELADLIDVSTPVEPNSIFMPLYRETVNDLGLPKKYVYSYSSESGRPASHCFVYSPAT